MEFRERLYQLHKGRGIFQEELAHTVGVSWRAAQKWEAGAATPDLNNLSALADYFAISLDYLVRGIEPEELAAPSPQQTVIQNYYRGWRYEYRNRRTLFGLPLVHISLCDRGLCRTKGVIAIGNMAIGLAAIGGFSAGLLTPGGFSVGLLALGGLAAGGIFLGGLSVGLLAALGEAAFSLGIAFGGGAVSGYAALGGAVVRQYAARGTAFDSTFAIGQDACSSAAGLALTLEQLHGYSPEVLFQMIHAQLPEAPEWVVHLLLCVCPWKRALARPRRDSSLICLLCKLDCVHSSRCPYHHR